MVKTKKKTNKLSRTLCFLLLLISFLCFCGARWYVIVYGRIGFDSVLFTLTSGLGGTQSGLIWKFLLGAAVPALLLAALATYILFFHPFSKFTGRKPCRFHTSVIIVAVLSLSLLGFAAWDIELADYIINQEKNTQLFENSYINPDDVNITFPEKKRNLVYIYLESMETSYLSKDLGGAMEENLIPELYQLAANNTNFSHHDGVGGFYCVPGSTWTVGSMVAQTSGIPLKPPTKDLNGYGVDGSPFLPGVTSMANILHENGYYQTLMVGSHANFGGREAYYLQHGADKVYDITTAQNDGIVPKDYFVWWGMEDLHLIEYAKQELTKIAQKEQPFAFTMLTVDTHHVGGYQCKLCQPSKSGETYDQSISCSSRQIGEFVKWLQEQPFYENTTVIIVGDHESMDNGYFHRMVDSDYQRMVYDCIINAPVSTDNTKNRAFIAEDMFPTTLAALGCTIDGNRLGLGTNLYSDLPTLTESMGLYSMSLELSKSSPYYEDNFINP